MPSVHTIDTYQFREFPLTAAAAGAVGESVVETVVTRKNIFSNVFAVRENIAFCLCFGHVEHL